MALSHLFVKIPRSRISKVILLLKGRGYPVKVTCQRTQQANLPAYLQTDLILYVKQVIRYSKYQLLKYFG